MTSGISVKATFWFEEHIPSAHMDSLSTVLTCHKVELLFF